MDNLTLKILNLADNEIDDKLAKDILDVLESSNTFMEEIILSGNNLVHFQTIENLDKACRKNILIKEFVIPSLQKWDSSMPAKIEGKG